ncbi:MAG: T9SS C-terminal target domain-containing protein [Winogradskyella sp.]|nr:MAG: T9SS C-terminal target domain-containing protein [Winogradskyella sp.]
MCLAFNTLFSQNPEDILTNLNFPTSLTIIGDDLYFSQIDGSINKIDITESNPNISSVATGFSTILALANDGSSLYITENGAGEISSYNLNDSSSSTLINNLSDPRGLGVYQNKLYYAEWLNGTISEINISSPSSPNTIISSSLGYTPILINGSKLYYSSHFENNISVIDLAQPNPVPSVVVSVPSNLFGLAMIGDELFFSQESGKVSKIDVTENSPAIEDVITDLGSNNPYGMVSSGDDLYVALSTTGKIIRYSTNNNLSTTEFESTDNVLVYPNPVNNKLIIESSDTISKVIVINQIGQRVITSNTSEINLSTLENGFYMLIIHNEFGSITKKIFKN